MEVIILAGGLGTRLRGVIGDAPKCMAPVNGQPFLHYIFREIEQQGATRVILSLGYRHEAVLEWLTGTRWSFEVDHVIEQEPLGTGGGIRLAMQQVKEPSALVLNGDTLFRIPLAALVGFHSATGAVTSLALKPMRHFDRYGIVVTGTDGRIISFEEKKAREAGLINGGIYCISTAEFLALSLPERFSFEKDYLEAMKDELPFYGLECDNYFIDIGVPEDYRQSEIDFSRMFPS